jgi:hypothetical protein
MAKTSGSEQAVQATNDDATISKLYLLLLIPLLSVLAFEFYALCLLSLFRHLRNWVFLFELSLRNDGSGDVVGHV